MPILIRRHRLPQFAVLHTTTEKGLSVICQIDENHYERGKKITEEQKENLNIEFTGPNEKWNYIIRPNV